MRSNLTFKSPLTFLIGLVIIFQSCSVYRSNPVSLEKAASSETKVKVLTTANEKVKYKRIESVDNRYFGVKKVKGEFVKVELLEEEISSIRLKNKGLSTFLSVVLVGVLVILAPAIAFAIGGGV